MPGDSSDVEYVTMEEFIRYKDGIRNEITRMNQDIGGIRYSLENNFKQIDNSIKQFENNFKLIENHFKALSEMLGKEFGEIRGMLAGNQPWTSANPTQMDP